MNLRQQILAAALWLMACVTCLVIAALIGVGIHNAFFSP